jgi:hypothetical protein
MYADIPEDVVDAAVSEVEVDNIETMWEGFGVDKTGFSSDMLLYKPDNDGKYQDSQSTNLVTKELDGILSVKINGDLIIQYRMPKEHDEALDNFSEIFDECLDKTVDSIKGWEAS